MSRIARVPSRLLFAAAVVGALAFGAAQAFAAPRAAEAGAYCDNDTCAYLCGGLGYCRGQFCACY